VEIKLRSVLVLLAIAAMSAPRADAQLGGSGNSGGGVGSGGFGGPAILSRGTGPVGRNQAKRTNLRYHIGLQGFYATGVTTPLASSDDIYGGSLIGGLNGSYVGARSWASIGWGGTFDYYGKGGARLNPNQGGAFTYGRILSRKWTLFTSVASRTNSRQLANLDTNFSDDPTAELSSPTNEFFDSRSYGGSGAIGSTYQMTRRIAISLSGGATLQRFSSGSLIGSNAFSGSTSTFYTLNRRSGVGVSASAAKFYFPGRYGESMVVSASGHYSRALTERWRVNFSGGRYAVDSTRLVRVAVDPFIAALIGQSSFLEILDRKNRGYSGRVTLSGRLGKSGVSLGYGNSIIPGNGVFLTSSNATSSLHYTFTGTTRWNYGVGVNYSRTKSLIQDVNAYETLGGNVNGAYRLNTFMHLTLGANYLRSSLRSSTFSRDRVFFSLGIAFSPGTIPLPLF
jgi:hypothetical protein